MGKAAKIATLALLGAALSACLALAGCAEEVSVPMPPSVGNPVPEMKEAMAERLRAQHEEELKQPFYALVLGGDSRVNTREGDPAEDDSYSRGYSDTIMLVRVNPGNSHMTIVSIPRDTAAVRNDRPGKINDFMQFDGAEATVAYVEQAAGVDIKYYFVTEFARFAQLINAVGGIDVEVPLTLSCGDPIEGRDIVLEPGWQHLGGAEALVYSRTRKAYGDEQDACRQVQDRNVVMTLLRKAADGSSEDLDSFISALVANTDTNLPLEDLQFYAKLFYENRDNLSFTTGTMPYTGDLNPESERWEVPMDAGTWSAIVQVMEEEGDPTAIVALPQIWAAE